VQSLYLVRHAVAADQDSWSQPDASRPLTEFGWQQALALAQVLGRVRVEAFRASPTVRCQDTLVPAAHTTGLAVEDDPLLFEGAQPTGPEEAGQMLRRLIESYFTAGVQVAAACSHGNVLLPLLEAASPGAGARCPKGGLWKLEIDGSALRSVSFVGRLVPATSKWEAR